MFGGWSEQHYIDGGNVMIHSASVDIDDGGGGGDDHIKGHCIYEGWRIKVVLMFAKM